MVSTWDINNKRVKSLHINNKEIKSMVRVSDSAILYQNQPDNYLLTLTSDKDILSYADHESATLTATLTNNSVPVSGETVVFTMNGTTDSLTSDNGHVEQHTGTISYSSNGLTLNGNTNTIAYYTYHLMDLANVSYRIEMDCTKTENTYIIGKISNADDSSGEDLTFQLYTSSGYLFNSGSFQMPSGLGSTIHIAIEISPTAQKIYVNNQLVGTATKSITSTALKRLEFWKTSFDPVYTIKNLSISELIGSDTTDANGEATVSYLGNHTNTLYIRAKTGSLESNQISIDDLWDYDPMTSDSGKWNWGSITHSFSSNGCQITGSVMGEALYNKQLPSNFEVEATFHFDETTEDMFTIGRYTIYHGTSSSINSLIIFSWHDPDGWSNRTAVAMNRLNTDITLKFRYENGTVSVLNGDTILAYKPGGNLLDYPLSICYLGRIRSIKDVKIRQL